MIARRTLFAAPLALAWPLTASPAHAEETLQEAIIAVSSTSFVLAGVLLGQQAGLFERHGLKLRIVVMDSGNAAMAALLSGSVPFAVAGPSDVLTARARGQDVVIVANLYAGLAGSVVLGKSVVEKLNVAVKAPLKERLHALDGLVIAVPSATSALLAPIRAAAEEAGAKVRFIYMAQGTMPAALEKNAIQGMVASYPFAGVPVLHGTGVIWVDGPGGELPADVLPASSSCVQTTSTFIAAHKDTVRRLQQAVAAVGRFISQDHPAAQRALAAAYPQLSAEEIDLSFKQQWRNWTKPFLTEQDIRQEIKLLIASTKATNLERLDPTTALIGPL